MDSVPYRAGPGGRPVRERCFGHGHRLLGGVLNDALKVDSNVRLRPFHWMCRRGGQAATRRGRWTNEQFWAMGLYRLGGTIRFPAQALSVRSS